MIHNVLCVPLLVHMEVDQMCFLINKYSTVMIIRYTVTGIKCFYSVFCHLIARTVHEYND